MSRRLVAAGGIIPTLALALSLLGISPPAHADSVARQHLIEGYRLKQRGKPQEALAHLTESFRLDPQLQTLINLADCEEQLQLLVEARQHWLLAKEQAVRVGDSRTLAGAEAHANELAKRIPQLTIRLTREVPGNAVVYRDGARISPASLGVPLPTNPGEHRVVVKTPGHADWEQVLILKERDHQVVTASVGPGMGDASPDGRRTWSPGSTQKTLGIVAGSAGLVSLAVATLFWQRAARDLKTDDAARSATRRDIVVTNVSLISSCVLLGGGVLLFVTAPPQRPKPAAFRLLPTFNVAGDGAQLGARGEFY